MVVSATIGSLKRLRNVSWGFQQTFKTPLQNLQPFVATILSARKQIEAGAITIDSIIAEPRALNAMLANRSLPSSLQREFSIEATGSDDAAVLLQAALTDSIDFWFVPSPKSFTIYADHDEYATFFASSKSNLNGVVQPLLKQGFKTVDYERKL